MNVNGARSISLINSVGQLIVAVASLIGISVNVAGRLLTCRRKALALKNIVYRSVLVQLLSTTDYFIERYTG